MDIVNDYTLRRSEKADLSNIEDICRGRDE